MNQLNISSLAPPVCLFPWSSISSIQSSVFRQALRQVGGPLAMRRGVSCSVLSPSLCCRRNHVDSHIQQRHLLVLLLAVVSSSSTHQSSLGHELTVFNTIKCDVDEWRPSRQWHMAYGTSSEYHIRSAEIMEAVVYRWWWGGCSLIIIFGGGLLAGGWRI